MKNLNYLKKLYFRTKDFKSNVNLGDVDSKINLKQEINNRYNRTKNF